MLKKEQYALREIKEKVTQCELHLRNAQSKSDDGRIAACNIEIGSGIRLLNEIKALMKDIDRW